MSDKKFIGIVKVIETKFGPLAKVGISKADFDKHQVNGWVNFMIKTNKEGKMYLEVDDWKPDANKATDTVK